MLFWRISSHKVNSFLDYLFAHLIQTIESCAQSIDGTSLASFLRLYASIVDLADMDRYYRDCFHSIDLALLAKKSEKLKNYSQEYLNSAHEAARYKSMIHRMRKVSDMKKTLIELVSLVQEKMLPGTRAAICQELKKAIDDYEWASFSDGAIFCDGFHSLGAKSKTAHRRT